MDKKIKLIQLQKNIGKRQDIIEQYEGEFENGQYHGKGTLVDRHGEVLEGTFKENKFVKAN